MTDAVHGPAPARVDVRRAGPADGAALARLRAEGTGADPADPATERFVEDFRTWVADHRDSHVPFVVLLDGEVVGMAWLSLAERVPGPGQPVRRCGDLQTVFVTPALRGRGIGSALLGAIRAEARELRLEHVTVHANARAEPVYRRAGFEPGEHWLAWHLT